MLSLMADWQGMGLTGNEVPQHQHHGMEMESMWLL